MRKKTILICLLFIVQSLISQVNLPESKATSKTTANSKISLRQSQQGIAILWDNSLSMNNRLLHKELQFLDAYFKKNRNVKVKFQTFGTDLGAVQKHKVTEGNWEALKQTILEVVYDGATNQEVLKKLKIGVHTFLFTDGNRFNENLNRKWKGTVFTINSKGNANHALLKSIAEDSNASYINLEKTVDMSVAITYTNQYMTDNIKYSKKKQAAVVHKEIKGNVSDFDQPISNVTVQVKGTDRKVKTDSDGNFSIKAQTGDVLVYTYVGRESTASVVNSTTRTLLVTMPLGVKNLDEVILEENKKEDALSAPLHENVTTNFGVLNARASGFMIKQISGDEITNMSGTILDVMRGKFAGVIVGRSGVLIRGGFPRFDAAIGAAWDVDGLLYDYNNPPFHINVFNIKSITIMPGSWAQARYGLLGRGGIVIVRTISGSFEDMKARKDHLYDQAMLRNNIYKGDAVYFENKLDSQPKYIQAIANETTYENAYQQYLLQRNSYGHLAHFYVDVHNHFSQNLKSEKIANRILSNIEELFNNDVNALKGLAYTYEEKGLDLKAQSIYKTIYALKPSLVQSQRDLAHSYAKLGNYKKAWSLYGKHIKSVNDSLASSGTDVIIKNELLELLQYHGEDMDIDVSQYIFDTEKGDMTLSVEWNNPNTQFELQFVGPEQHYYNWNNAVDISNAQLLKGNFSNSFTIDDLSKGEWLINIKYLGNYENTPSYLKFTIKDNNTGKETIKTLKLQTRNIFYKFMSISPPDQIVSY